MKNDFIVLIVLILIVLFIVLFKSGSNICGQTIGSAKQVGNEETFIVCNLTFLAFPFGCSEIFYIN